jgi:cysteine synthase A
MYNSNNTEPDWFVHSAGTGGTLTSVARYARRNTLKTKCALADTEYSPFFDWVVNGWFNGNENDIALWKDPGISGIGFNPAIAHQLTFGETTRLAFSFSMERCITSSAVYVWQVVTNLGKS